MSDFGFNVKSIYGANTGEGRIVITDPTGDEHQTSADEARALALNLLQAAEAADQEGFLVAWLAGRMRVDQSTAAVVVLAEYRRWRDEHGGG